MFNGSAYKTLGLKEGASAEEIKTAYRRLAMKHHPDRGGDPEEFKKIQSAYDYLNSVGDHVQLRKRARPDNSNFNYSFFNQAEMAEIFKNLRENLSSLVIEIPVSLALNKSYTICASDNYEEILEKYNKIKGEELC